MGRVDYGSGKKLARDWQLKLTVDKHSGDITFADHSKAGKQNFGEACEQFIARIAINVGHPPPVRPCLPHLCHDLCSVVRTLAQVAQDRDGFTELTDDDDGGPEQLAATASAPTHCRHLRRGS